MGIDRREYGEGTSVTQSFPWGWYISARVMCSDGVVRAVKRISETADTFFSVPCAVAVRGKTVSGYMTFDTAEGFSTETEDDPTVLKFIAYTYGKNGHVLPEGKWVRS